MAEQNQYGYYRDVDLNSEGRLGTVQHSHPDNVNLHIHLTNQSANGDFILIDLDDPTNYHHSGTTYIHIENVWFDVDASNTAAYQATIGYLTDVNATGGTFVHLYTINGGKQAGNSKEVILPIYPNGARMDDRFVVTHDRLTSATYASTNPLPSTLDPTTANVNPANGDLVLNVEVTAGSINLAINVSYHGHQD